MSDPPNGVGPRGTLPLGVCPGYPSPYATRQVERELRETVRLRRRWRAAGAMIIAFGAVGIVALVLTQSAHHELPKLRQEAELPATGIPTAPRAPEPAPPVALTFTPASAPTSTAPAMSPPRARQPGVPRRDTPAIVRSSDVVDPWR